MKLRLFHLVLMSETALDEARSDSYLAALGDAKNRYWGGYADALEDISGKKNITGREAETIYDLGRRSAAGDVTGLAESVGVLVPGGPQIPAPRQIRRGHLRLVTS